MLLGSGHHRKNESCYWLPPDPPLPTAHPKAPDSTAPPFPFLQLLLLTASCPPPLLPICSCIHPSIHLKLMFAAALRSARSSKVTSDKMQERPGMRPAFCAAYQITAWLVWMRGTVGEGVGQQQWESLAREGRRGGSCHEKPRHSCVWNLFLAA